jgi:hypothetical protein
VIPAAVASIIAVTRTVLEGRSLQEDLPGYRGCARRVRYDVGIMTLGNADPFRLLTE